MIQQEYDDDVHIKHLWWDNECVYIIKSNLEKIKWEYSGEKELLGRDVYGREEKRVEL